MISKRFFKRVEMKVLVVQLRQMGDVLLSSVIAEGIKRQVPNSTVHFLTLSPNACILRGNPFIDKILTLDKSLLSELKTTLKVIRENYYAIIDVQRTGRSKRITFLSRAKLKIAFKGKDNFYYNVLVEREPCEYTAWDRLVLLKGLGLKPLKLFPKFYFEEGELGEVEKLVKEKIKTKYFVVVPTSRRKKRSWNPEYFGKLARMIFEKTGYTPVFTGAKGEEELVRTAYNSSGVGILLPAFPVRIFAGILKFSEFCVCNDSFAGHLSVALGKRVVVIIGPYEEWFVENERTVKVKKGLNCQPCSDWKKCPYELACFSTLSPEEVFSKIEKKLEAWT